MKPLTLFALIAAAVILPRHLPMFDGMIVRCEPDGKCHWECEFGVVTSSAMVNENLVVKPSGCEPKPTPQPKVIYENNPFKAFTPQ